jgi:hypothetical protein
VTLGPLEYIVVGFVGNNFDGSIAAEIARAVESGTIRLVDVVVIAKDVDGNATVLEVNLQDDPRFRSFSNLLEGTTGLFTEEDVLAIAETIPSNMAAAALLFEHKWAVHIKEAMERANGFLISRTVIAPEIVEEIAAELEAAQADEAAAALGTGA